jgi:transcriptional regulator with XRE-family HTH domain
MKGHFGKVLRQLREEAKVSMGTLARHLEISVAYLSDVERGNRAPLTNERILNAAEFLHAEAGPLLEVAAESRGYYELSASELSPQGRQVGATLMRGWPTYTDKHFEEIARLLQRIDAMERNRRGKS